MPHSRRDGLSVCCDRAGKRGTRGGGFREAAEGRAEALENLLSERDSPDELERAVVEAREVGIPEQAILEARFLFHVDRGEDAEIAALLPVFEERARAFRLEDSRIFAREEDWLAVLEYARALEAMEEGNKAAFKRHITEAFWLSPRQGAAFAPHIERMRVKEAMEKVRVEMGTTYADLFGGEPLTPEEVLGGGKGLLLYFWSPRSLECKATMADFFTTAERLATGGIAVVSVLPETSPEIRKEAVEALAATGKKAPGTWVVDREKRALSGELKIRSVPAFVLLSPGGGVLFNGHPTDNEFWEALEELDAGIARPVPGGEE